MGKTESNSLRNFEKLIEMVDTLHGPKGTNQYINSRFFDKGGMGRVYLFDDTISGEKVIVKFITITTHEEEKLLKSEFVIATKFNHPNIVKTIYFDNIEFRSEHYLYSVMEYCPNGNLHKLLSLNNGGIQYERAIELMIDIASGLEEAHKLIIHRDLKPANILIGLDGGLKICDFGIAKYVNDSTRTRTFKGWGTDSYTAPECWKFEENKPVMDIYSLGIIFFEILTGMLPFPGKNVNEIRNKHLYEPLPDLLKINSGIPVKIAQVVRKMTAKNPSHRYQSAAEILVVLKKNSELEFDTRIYKIQVNAHKEIIKDDKEKQDKRKKEEEDLEKEKIIKVGIHDLFANISQVIEQINNGMEGEKIAFVEYHKNMEIKFLNSSSKIDLFGPSFIEANSGDAAKIMISGVVESGEFKFNLFLRKKNNIDLYGEWWVGWLDKFLVSPTDSKVSSEILSPHIFTKYLQNSLEKKDNIDQWPNRYLIDFSESATPVSISSVYMVYKPLTSEISDLLEAMVNPYFGEDNNQSKLDEFKLREDNLYFKKCIKKEDYIKYLNLGFKQNKKEAEAKIEEFTIKEDNLYYENCIKKEDYIKYLNLGFMQNKKEAEAKIEEFNRLFDERVAKAEEKYKIEVEKAKEQQKIREKEVQKQKKRYKTKQKFVNKQDYDTKVSNTIAKESFTFGISGFFLGSIIGVFPGLWYIFTHTVENISPFSENIWNGILLMLKFGMSGFAIMFVLGLIFFSIVTPR